MKLNTHTVSFVTATFFSSLFIADVVRADFDKTIEDALKFGDGGAIKFDANYRWENVDRDAGADNTANANTIRTRIGVLSPKFHGFQGFAEYEGTHALQADYNDGRGNKPAFSPIADPAQNELNQLWITYSNFDTVVKGGRQRIKLDDDRFIGNVGWRQLETTFDAVLVTNNSIKDLTVNAGYLGNVQTFLSTTENIDAPILNVNYKLGDYGNVIGYGYWLDYTEKENFGKSNQTYGLRFNGATPKIYNHYNLLYTAEWSIQQDYGHQTTAYEAHRYNAMGGFNAYFMTFQGAVEQLNGNGTNAFITPLGTNHAFQGWADLFAATTPKNGIRDVFGTVSAKVLDDSLTVAGVYHDYTDDTGNVSYGKEWDFQAVKKFGKHYSVLAKYANYEADNAATTDTQKIWLQGNVNF
ncbi:MAG: alginate export family protein [Methylococcales bacterium]|nr:alginate export family protein [Methylococcales bacterium]